MNCYAAAASVVEKCDPDYLALLDLIDGNCLERALCRRRRNDALMVDDKPPEGHSLDDLGTHIRVAEAQLVPSAHLGLACLRDFIGVVCK